MLSAIPTEKTMWAVHRSARHVAAVATVITMHRAVEASFAFRAVALFTSISTAETFHF
jgi:hypothetical protein